MKQKLLLFFLVFVTAINAQVNCNNLALPFVETFEGNSPTLTCWSNINANNDAQQWNTSLNNAYNSTQCKSLTLHNLAQFGTANDWLLSPEINLGNDGTTKQLKFLYKTFTASTYWVESCTKTKSFGSYQCWFNSC